jgi:hypothetical protein
VNPEVFYLHIQGEQRGPYTVPQIDHLLNSGLIQEETLFWREGLDQWQPVTDLVALRKPKRRWVLPAIAAGFLLVLALLTRLFGPTIREGWREANAHDFTSDSAYWRARDMIRHGSVPPGTLLEFAPESTAQIQLEQPGSARVFLRGTAVDAHGAARDTGWEVELKYDEQLKEWSGVTVKENTPSP